MKLIKYIAATALTIAIASCGNDWLNLEPSTSTDSSNGLQDLQQVDYSLNGIYNKMQDPYLYTGRIVYYADVCGDDMQAVSSSKRTGSYYLFNYNKDNAPSSHWSYLYSMVRACNTILGDTAQVRATITKETDNATLTSYIGETLALRALAMFDLTRLFGYPYTKDGGASLGVPVITTVAENF
ncbi:MAG: RagB/SusD family nutrient uptake outer membrane protein, partial [Mediterranea sp.]|nr:RagB/SusD family nutrient uptake outer membrane protein [Mediterranea sp.]